LTSNCEFLILKNCLSIGKFNFILRTVPWSQLESSCRAYDDIIFNTLSSLVSSPLSSSQCIQASLPTRYGGLGLTSAISISEPAYCSLRHSCNLIEDKFPIT